MPKPQKVYVGIMVSDGAIVVSVSPWSCHVAPDQKVRWVRATPKISRLVIKKDSAGAAWPFDPAPPNPAYRGTSPVTPNGRNPGLPVGKRYRYTIDVTFTHQGRTRSLTIDPDMVIDA